MGAGGGDPSASAPAATWCASERARASLVRGRGRCYRAGCARASVGRRKGHMEIGADSRGPRGDETRERGWC
jgi:hypothetical protein